MKYWRWKDNKAILPSRLQFSWKQRYTLNMEIKRTGAMIQIGKREFAEEGYLTQAGCGSCGRIERREEYVQIWAETSSFLGLQDYKGFRCSQGWVGDREGWARDWILFLFCLGFIYDNLLFDFHMGDELIKQKITQYIGMFIHKLYISYFTVSSFSSFEFSVMYI